MSGIDGWMEKRMLEIKERERELDKEREELSRGKSVASRIYSHVVAGWMEARKDARHRK